MKQVNHLRQQKQFLEFRSACIRSLRTFFWSQEFLEVDAPNIIRLPGQEPYLSPMRITVHDETGSVHAGYLHTSPEYTMKKMLAAGFEKIFYTGKCYRDYESFGGLHNPEFTLAEWYRAQRDFWALMDDVEQLFLFVSDEMQKAGYTVAPISAFRRVHMRDLWREHVKVDLDEYVTIASMARLCREKGYTVTADEPYEDLFYRIFLNHIEPVLREPTIVHHYPAQMAALSKVSASDQRYAERFEVYVQGIELANAFTELTDAEEQEKRLRLERAQREKMGKDVFDIDIEFIRALGEMPPSAGIALGVDRFVQVLAGCKNIDDVLVLPMSQLFES